MGRIERERHDGKEAALMISRVGNEVGMGGILHLESMKHLSLSPNWTAELVYKAWALG
jgi:hypothetical protein